MEKETKKRMGLRHRRTVHRETKTTPSSLGLNRSQKEKERDWRLRMIIVDLWAT
jgi:hypothetical protein